MRNDPVKAHGIGRNKKIPILWTLNVTRQEKDFDSQSLQSYNIFRHIRARIECIHIGEKSFRIIVGIDTAS